MSAQIVLCECYYIREKDPPHYYHRQHSVSLTFPFIMYNNLHASLSSNGDSISCLIRLLTTTTTSIPVQADHHVCNRHTNPHHHVITTPRLPKRPTSIRLLSTNVALQCILPFLVANHASSIDFNYPLASHIPTATQISQTSSARATSPTSHPPSTSSRSTAGLLLRLVCVHIYFAGFAFSYSTSVC